MGLFSWLRKSTPQAETTEERSSYIYDDAAYCMLTGIGFGADLDEVTVTPETALTATAVYAAVSIISGAIATLPIHVRDRKTNDIITDHPAARLFRSPNEFMTWPDYCEAYCLNLLTTGNGYSWSERDSYYDPIGLYPLKSCNTEPRREAGRLRYVSMASGTPSSLPAESVIHTKNMSWDGICGISPLRAGAGAVGLSLSLEKFARKFFVNGSNVGNVLELPPMTPEALAEFKRRWKSEYEGLDNAHKMAAAPGLKVHKSGYSPRDSQAIESRKHQLAEVARIYQTPPHMLGDLDRATFSNIEDQSRDFAERTLRRWVVKIEASHERILLREDEREKLKIRLNLGAIIRGSLKDQIEALTKATGGAPVMTQNEARDHLGYRPKPGGDVLLQNLNQTPAEGKRSRALLKSIADNFATKEANAIRRAVKKHTTPEALSGWAGEFYRGHASMLAQALDGAGVSRRSVDRLCDEQRDSLLKAAKSDQIEVRILTIETQTAEHIADRLAAEMRETGEGEDNVREAA